jgi:hypothetical protein
MNDLLATGSMDSTVKIWDLYGNCRFTLEGANDEITVIH